MDDNNVVNHSDRVLNQITAVTICCLICVTVVKVTAIQNRGKR